MSPQPLKFNLEGGKYVYRSEVVGRTLNYELLDLLAGGSIRDVAEIPAKVGFESLDDSLVNLELLRRIGAVHADSFGVTKEGIEWFSLAGLINIPRFVPEVEILPRDKRSIPEFFLNDVLEPVVKRDEVERLLIVSPWISLDQTSYSRRLLKCLEELGSKTLIITRNPDKAWHLKALNTISTTRANIYVNEYVHSKIYVVKTRDRSRSVGILGSANLTIFAKEESIEIAVLFRGFSERNFVIIEYLLNSANDLKERKWV